MFLLKLAKDIQLIELITVMLSDISTVNKPSRIVHAYYFLNDISAIKSIAVVTPAIND